MSAEGSPHSILEELQFQIRMGKKMLQVENLGPNEKEIVSFIKTLAPTKTEKGVKRDKRPAELRCEAKRKLTNRMAKKVAVRYSLYSLRHSWATNAMKRGVARGTKSEPG